MHHKIDANHGYVFSNNARLNQLQEICQYSDDLFRHCLALISCILKIFLKPDIIEWQIEEDETGFWLSKAETHSAVNFLPVSSSGHMSPPCFKDCGKG